MYGQAVPGVVQAGAEVVHGVRVQLEDMAAEAEPMLRVAGNESRQVRPRRVEVEHTARFVVAKDASQRLESESEGAAEWPSRNTSQRCSNAVGCFTAVPPPNAV